MPLESATFVNQLDQTRPTATDVKSEGDDVMRLIKSTLKNSFPNVGGAMNASHTELNRSVGLTEDIQPRLSATIAAPGGETLNRLPAAASRLGGYLTFNASTGQPEVNFSIGQASASSVGIFNASNITTFFTAGTERMRIDATGVRAASSFAVGDSSGNLSGAMLNESDTSKSVTFAADPGNVGASSFMRFNVDGTERMRLDGVGNVGINTNAPGSTLDMRGPNGLGVRYIETATGNTNRIQFGTGAGFGYIDATAGIGSPSLVLQTASTERMRIDSSGNVGVGITPSNRLHAGGITRISDATNSTAVTIDPITTAGTTAITAQFGGSQLTLGTAGTERVRIDGSGNVGIGGSPSVALHIQRTSANAEARISTYTSGDPRLTLAAEGVNGGSVRYTRSNQQLILENAGVDAVTVTSAGNVIQQAPTTPPSLTVNGQLVMNLTSNTNLRISVRGTDGVTRVANITLA